MPVANHRLPLCPADLEELHASGLADATIRGAGIYTERDHARLASLLKYDSIPDFCLGGGMVFPFFDAEGNRNGYATVKPYQPRIRDDKPVKYCRFTLVTFACRNLKPRRRFPVCTGSKL